MSDLLARYRRHYGIPGHVPLDLDDLRHHLVVELEVTRELLASAPESRRETFERGYSRIYNELWWFNAADEGAADRVDPSPWIKMIGPPPRRVYEVASGQGGLARALARSGYEVEATDITIERGGDRAPEPNLRWSTTDGVHLDHDAQPSAYDAVISDQFVEHLHPDDLIDHFRGASALLKPGGRYAFRTPHGPSGPWDSSLVFGFPVALGTHLREYGFAERVAALQAAGFATVMAESPGLGQRRRGRVHPSARYLRYLLAVEARLAPIPLRTRRWLALRLLRGGLFHRDAILVACKAADPPGSRSACGMPP